MSTSTATAASPRQRLARWAAYGAYYALLAGFFVELFAWARQLGRLLKPLDEPLVPMFLPLVLLGLAGAGALLVHEGGHWLGSWWADLRCYAVVVGWLRLERQPTGWKLYLARWPKGMGGYVHALPEAHTRLRWRQALFVGAGPAASLLAGSLALLAALPHWHEAGAGSFSLARAVLVHAVVAFGGISLLTGLGNLLPFQLRTDGSHLLALLRDGPAWQRQAALIRLTSASRVHQQRPRHWPAASLPPLLAYADQSVADCVAHYLAYAHAIDQPSPDAATARHHLQQAIDRRHLASKEIERALYAEAAYCAAMLTHNDANARHWLKRMAEVAPLTDKDAFTQAVVAYSCQEHAQARQWLQKCQSEVDALPESDLRAQSQERLAAVWALVTQPEVEQAASHPANTPGN